jgi:CDP-diacylglycerol--serine O-phosphatidyltransferase
MNFLLGILAIMLMADALGGPESGAPVFGKAKDPLILGAWIITWCVLLDKLDGFAARLLKASSEFGAQFDSLADLTAFGVAPGFLVYFYLQVSDYTWFASHRALMVVSVFVYMVCAALRLARYNAIDSDDLKGYFQGLPSTFAGGLIALTVILFHKHQWGGLFPGANLILPISLIAAGLLMVSPLYLPKLVKRPGKWLNGFQAIGVLSGYLCGLSMIFPEWLYAQLWAYGILGFGYGLLKKDSIESARSDSQAQIS